MGRPPVGRACLAAVAVVATAACGATSTSTASTTAAAPEATASADLSPTAPRMTNPTPSTSPSPRDGGPAKGRRGDAGAWLAYQVSGGIDGRLERLVIDPGGGAELTLGVRGSPRRIRLDPDTVQALRTAMDGVTFADLPAAEEAPQPDALATTITHNGRMATASPDESRSLVALLEELDDIVDEHRPS